MDVTCKNSEVGIPEEMKMAFEEMIDHTLLKPDATKDQVKKICKEAV